MNIVYLNPQNINIKIKKKVHQFLDEYIPEGSVIFSNTIYDMANMWTLLIKDEEIVGFCAHRIFDLKDYYIIQIMGTYLANNVRGMKHGALLLHAHFFIKAFQRNPFKKIILCTRTRIPKVLYLASLYSDVYPKAKKLKKNIKFSSVAEKIAKIVYGQNIVFCKKNFVMQGSYPHNSAFKIPNLKEKSKEHNYFIKNLNFSKNECIFMISCLEIKMLIYYACALFLWKTCSISNFLKKNFLIKTKGLIYAFICKLQIYRLKS